MVIRRSILGKKEELPTGRYDGQIRKTNFDVPSGPVRKEIKGSPYVSGKRGMEIQLETELRRI